MKRKPIAASKVVQQWFMKYKKTMRSEYLYTASNMSMRRTIIIPYKLAGYTSIVGGTSDEKAKQLYKVLVDLFFHKDRKKQWASGLKELPIERDNLIKFTEVIEGYEELAKQKYVNSLRESKIKLDQIIRYACKVLNKKNAFLEASRDSWRRWPSQLFSETLLREAKRTHRGAFGDLQDLVPDQDDRLNDIETV